MDNLCNRTCLEVEVVVTMAEQLIFFKQYKVADTQFNAQRLVMLTRGDATLNCEVGLVKVTSVRTETTSGHISDKIANRKL